MHWSGKLVFCETEKKCSWLVGFGWMVLAAFERVLIDRRSNSEWAQRNDGVEPKQCRWCSCCCCWICVSVVVQLFTTIFHCRLFCLSEIEYVSVVDGLCECFFFHQKKKYGTIKHAPFNASMHGGNGYTNALHRMIVCVNFFQLRQLKE